MPYHWHLNPLPYDIYIPYHMALAGVRFVRNTGHLDEAITTIVNGYIATLGLNRLNDAF